MGKQQQREQAVARQRVREAWLSARAARARQIIAEQRQSLLAAYATWLRDHRILESEGVWRQAVTNEFLPAESRAA